VIEGQNTLDNLYKGYGDIPPFGHGPDQQKLHRQGNNYIRTNFPQIDFINSCILLEDGTVASTIKSIVHNEELREHGHHHEELLEHIHHEELLEDGHHLKELREHGHHHEHHHEELLEDGHHLKELLEHIHHEELLEHDHYHEELVEHGHHHEELLEHGQHHHEELLEDGHHLEELLEHIHHNEELVERGHHNEELVEHGHHHEELLEHGHHHEELLEHGHDHKELREHGHLHEELVPVVPMEVDAVQDLNILKRNQESEFLLNNPDLEKEVSSSFVHLVFKGVFVVVLILIMLCLYKRYSDPKSYYRPRVKRTKSFDAEV